MIVLDYRDPRPIYEQIVQKMADLILAGVLAEGEQLPSVRSLASDLSINPNTIQRAYAELERRGYTYSVKGRGSFAAGGAVLREQRKTEALSRLHAALEDAEKAGVSREEAAGIVAEIFHGG